MSTPCSESTAVACCYNDMGGVHSDMKEPDRALELYEQVAAIQDNADAVPPRPGLSGVRFAPLSGPGPTGTRPEHIKEMLSVRRRSYAKHLLRAIDHRPLAGVRGNHVRRRLRAVPLRQIVLEGDAPPTELRHARLRL